MSKNKSQSSSLSVSASLRENSSPSASPAGAHTTEQETALAVAGAGPLTDADLGAQLTAQYHRATGGMTEVLRFGGMMMQLREHIESTRGLVGKFEAGTGVDAWLKEHAPEVKKPTAYRFLHVAEAVANGFENTSGLSFPELVTAAPDQLPEPARHSQQELWDFVNGTSQRSWLDRFAPKEKTSPEVPKALAEKAFKKSPEEKEAQLQAEVIGTFATLDKYVDKGTWKVLTDSQARTAIDIFKRFIKDAEAHLAIPKAERVAAKLKALRA